MPIPDEFFISGAGDRNFDEDTRVLVQRGDWLMATYFSSAYPVPSGWTTVNNHSLENLLVFSRGGIEVTGDEVDGYVFEPEPEVAIQIGVGWETGVTDVATLLDEAEALLLEDETTKPLLTEYGADRGFLLVTSEDRTGAPIHALIFYTRLTNYEGDTGFTAIVARWNSDAAAEYYSIVRAIIGGWADLNNNLLGAELPRDLPS